MSIDPAAAKALFLEAAAIADPRARAALVAERCDGNSELLARVHALLAANDRAMALADTPAVGGSDARGPATPTDEHAGTVIAGKYTLVEVIGEGGMGSVWRAKQSEPVKRFVAVKLIKAGMDSKQVLARFEAERQALALMDHPNIAKVLDGGLHDGRPFFVMELVKGVPITDYSDHHKLPPRERLELFVPVCQAIQHAHQKGIIHRDIKPSNVLIALYDDKPVVKVIDFGVAKATGGTLTEATIDTGFGGVVGTPQYMSPEQATFNNLDIDTRSDVYALGVLLYELLTGSPPFSLKELEKKGLLEILRVVREEEPPRPSTRLSTADALPTLSANRGTEPKKLTRLLRRELDWIVMKALEKNRIRRYETANGFAADVMRYLAGEPVQAHPPSAAYRLRKFVLRNRPQVIGVGAMLALAFVSGLGGLRVGLIKSDEAEAARRAEAEAFGVRDAAVAERIQIAENAAAAIQLSHQETIRLAALRSTDLALSEYRNGNTDKAAQLLESVPDEHRSWDWRFVRRLNSTVRLSILAHPGKGLECLALSPDGARIATASEFDVAVWDARTGRKLKAIETEWVFQQLAFSADGKELVGASEDGVCVWDAETCRIARRSERGGFGSCVLSADATVAVNTSIDNHSFHVLSLRDFARRSLIQVPAHEFDCFSLNRDGSQLAMAGGAGIDGSFEIRLFETAGGKSIRTIKVGDLGKPIMQQIRGLAGLFKGLETYEAGEPSAIAYSHDGKLLAVAIPGGRIGIWETDRGHRVALLIGQPAEIRRLSFGRSSSDLVSAGVDGSVVVWDTKTGVPQTSVRAHPTVCNSVALMADQQSIVTGGVDGRIKVWSRARVPEYTALPARSLFSAGVSDFSLSADGRRLVTITVSGRTVSVHDDFGPARELKMPESDSPEDRSMLTGFTVDPTGRRVTQNVGKRLRILDTDDGRTLLTLPALQAEISACVFSPDGSLLVTGRLDGSCQVWDSVRGAQVWERGGRNCSIVAVAISPDGRFVFTGGADGEVHVMASGTGVLTHRFSANPGVVTRLAVSPNGKHLAAATDSGTTWIWDLTSRTELARLKGEPGLLSHISFTADGRRLAHVGADDRIRFWDPLAKQESLSLTVPNPSTLFGAGGKVAFSADGRRLVFGGVYGVFVWDTDVASSAEVTSNPDEAKQRQAERTKDTAPIEKGPMPREVK